METTFIFPSDNTRFKENGSENTLSNDLELTLLRISCSAKELLIIRSVFIFWLSATFSPILIPLTLKTFRLIKHGF